MEERIMEIIKDKLSLEYVVEEDKFSELGADSLDVLEIINEIEGEFEIDLTLEDMQCETVKELLEAVNENS